MFSVLLAALSLVGPAWAQDDDDFDLDDDIDLEDAPAPAPAPTTPPPPPADDTDDVTPDDSDERDDTLEEFREDGDETDLLGEEQLQASSADTEQIYRATQAKLSKLDADEELAGWEAYLAQYPNSVYRTRIEARMEELTDQMYATGIRTDAGGEVDAMRQEFDFAHPMQLENVNPRRRLQVGFEWGLPDYMNLLFDYEHALARTFSVHGGVKRRYIGWNIEAGARWAPVKSLRTNTLLTLMGDLHFNTNPVFPAFRPQLAFGKRLGILDLSVQGGADLTLQTFVNGDGSKSTVLQPYWLGGASLYFAASERVGVFGETYVNMKSGAADAAYPGGLFAFNVVTFGLKFFPGKATDRDKEVNFGATVPYMQRYWQYHYGSVMGQLNYYL